MGYQLGEHVWLKIPHSWCTTQYWIGRINGINFLIDGIPYHVKDLHPFVASDRSASETNSVSSHSERYVTIRGVSSLSSEADNSEPDNFMDTSELDNYSRDDFSGEETVIVSLRRSTRLKTPILGCQLWSHVISVD